MVISHQSLSPTRRRQRSIGPIGTAARVLVGLWLVGSVVNGHLAGEFRPAPWVLGLVGFPGSLVVLQWRRTRRTPVRLEATGPFAHFFNVALFFVLLYTPDYAPALWATSDAALLFYGGSMLLAALRGYAGCEVLAVGNWLLRRDDQLGCAVFAPVDYLERRCRQLRPDRSRRGRREDDVPAAGRPDY